MNWLWGNNIILEKMKIIVNSFQPTICLGLTTRLQNIVANIMSSFIVPLHKSVALSVVDLVCYKYLNRSYCEPHSVHSTAISQSKGDMLSSSAECRIRTRVFRTESQAYWMSAEKPTELSRIRLKHELNSLSLWSASIQPTWPHCCLAFVSCSCDIHVCFIVIYGFIFTSCGY